MGSIDNAALARSCRAQASLASTALTRATLLAMALTYDEKALQDLAIIEAEESDAQQAK